MRKLLSTLIVFLIITAVISNLQCDAATDLDSSLDSLTTQIVTSMSANKGSRIAVIEFSDLKGNITELGKFIAEELTTRLFMTKKFEVVERELLSKVLKEHKLNLSGLVDTSSAKELGKLLGVDAVVTGTITDLGKTVKINSRLIATETGTIFAAAGAELAKDEGIKNLLSQMINEPKTETVIVVPTFTPTPVPTPVPTLIPAPVPTVVINPTQPPSQVITSAGFNLKIVLAPAFCADNGHYYQIIPVAGITWDDAKKEAEALTYKGLKGHLATFTSNNEKRFVFGNMGRANNLQGYWIGGFQPDRSPEPRGNWKWVTGEPWKYSNWENGEPNNKNLNENALQLNAPDGKWNDVPRETTGMGFILEFSPEPPGKQKSDPNIVFLSDLEWTSASNGWGPVELDMTNGGDKEGDGSRINLGGRIYQKGLGVHAYSEILYNLDGKYSRFLADIGLESDKGTVVFEVWVDGNQVYSSGVMTIRHTKKVNVDVSGKNEHQLIVTDAGDGNSGERVVWAGARLMVSPGGKSD
jgi:TolB-like protein